MPAGGRRPGRQVQAQVTRIRPGRCDVHDTDRRTATGLIRVPIVDTGPWPAVRVLVTVEPGAGEPAGATLPRTLARAAASCRSHR
ncbi:MAG: hypothetical protein V7633_1618 [Pseudonocardia sp.]|jgi:hypothetical protein